MARKIRKSYAAVQKQLEDETITYPMAYRLLEAYGFERQTRSSNGNISFCYYPEQDNPVLIEMKHKDSGLLKHNKEELEQLKQAIKTAEAKGTKFPSDIFPYTTKKFEEWLEQKQFPTPGNSKTITIHPDSSTMFSLNDIKIGGGSQSGLSWMGEWVKNRRSRGCPTNFVYSQSHIDEWKRHENEDPLERIFSNMHLPEHTKHKAYDVDVSRFSRNMADISILLYAIASPEKQLILTDDKTLRGIIKALHRNDYISEINFLYDESIKELAHLLNEACCQQKDFCAELKKDVFDIDIDTPITKGIIEDNMGDLIDYYDAAEGKRHPSFFIDKGKLHRFMADVKLLRCIKEVISNVPDLNLPLTQVEVLNTHELMVLFDELNQCQGLELFASLKEEQIYADSTPNLEFTKAALTLACDRHGNPLCL